MKLSHRLTLAALVLSSSTFARADDLVPASIAVHPAEISLNHQRNLFAVQITGASAEGYSLDLHPQAKFQSANPAVATVDERGIVRPVANGQTQISVVIAGQTKTVPVKVQLPASEPSYSFRHEVMPVLSRAGCNMGACHGYSLGKNGFKLSLRGADPEQDYFVDRQGIR